MRGGTPGYLTVGLLATCPSMTGLVVGAEPDIAAAVRGVKARR